MPPVGLKVIVISDDGIPYISERETDALGVYCGLYCDEGYAEWWIEIPTNEPLRMPGPHTKEAIKNLHSAWRRLREIADEPDPVKRQHMIDLARIFLLDK